MPKGVPRSCCRKGFVGRNQGSPFCQGSSEVEAVADCLIEVEGYRSGGDDVGDGRQQLNGGRLDCRQRRTGEIRG
jgi:hypothetical protein